MRTQLEIEQNGVLKYSNMTTESLGTGQGNVKYSVKYVILDCLINLIEHYSTSSYAENFTVYKF